MTQLDPQMLQKIANSPAARAAALVAGAHTLGLGQSLEDAVEAEQQRIVEELQREEGVAAAVSLGASPFEKLADAVSGIQETASVGSLPTHNETHPLNEAQPQRGPVDNGDAMGLYPAVPAIFSNEVQQQQSLRSLPIICPDCERPFAQPKYDKRRVRKTKFYDVGMTCPHCDGRFHTHLETANLRKLFAQAERYSAIYIETQHPKVLRKYTSKRASYEAKFSQIQQHRAEFGLLAPDEIERGEADE